MKKLILSGLGCLVLLFAVGPTAQAHCEVPCGIYGDEMRVQLIAEHITTLEKAMKQIKLLSAADEVNYNQLVRWVDNKEKHANEIQEIVTQYFMTQRIKVPRDDKDAEAMQAYVKNLTLLHKLLVKAMKAKQGTDLEVTAEMSELLDAFSESYLGKKLQ